MLDHGRARFFRRGFHGIGRLGDIFHGNAQDAVFNGDLAFRGIGFVRAVDGGLGIERVGHHALVALRQHRELRIADKGRALQQIAFFIQRQHAGRQAGFAVVLDFNGGERVRGMRFGLIERDTLHRHFAAEERQHHRLTRFQVEAVGEAEQYLCRGFRTLRGIRGLRDIGDCAFHHRRAGKWGRCSHVHCRTSSSACVCHYA